MLADGSERRLTAADGDLLRAARVGLGSLGVVVAVDAALRAVVPPARRSRAASRSRRCSTRCRSGRTPPSTSSSGPSRTPRSRSRASTPARRASATRPAAPASGSRTCCSRTTPWRPSTASPDASRARSRCSTAAPAGSLRAPSASTGRSASSPARAASASSRWSTPCRASMRSRPCAARARSSPATRSPSRSSCGSSPADDALLSPAHGRDTAYVAIHVFEGMAWEAPFREFEAFMSALDGRPHWGKHSFLTADRARPALPGLGRLPGCPPRARPRRPLRQRLGAARAGLVNCGIEGGARDCRRVIT